MPEPAPSSPIELARLAPALESTCGDYLSQYRARIEDAVRRGEGGVEVARKNAKSLDGLLSALCCACQAASAGEGGHRFALVAVGGYGRGVVGVESDVDVLFLCDDANDERVRGIAEGLLYPLWDLGVQIGHAVRSVEETLALAREDISTATTLLDIRRVAGDQGIVTELHKGARRRIFEPRLGPFLEMLEADTMRRHERFGDSLYLLEPEVKLGRGGLRDMDVAEWAMGARWNTRGSENYVRTGALLAREAEGFEAAREFFWKVRNLLHLRAGRRQDRLTFADQEDVSEQLGFVDGVTLGVEQFMQAYYRHARVVAQTAERVIARARPKQKSRPKVAEDLGDGTQRFGDHVTLTDSHSLVDDPALALRLYERVAELRIPPYPFARDAIATAAADSAWCEELRASEEAQLLFRRALSRSAEPIAGMRRTILAELHELGLMTAMIPEFEPLMGRVQHDVYHVYTVDVHSVRAVDRLHSLVRGELRKELPRATRLAAEAPRKEPLFLGLLLHDIGKARGKDHSEKGAEMAKPIAERLGLSTVDVDHVEWLVREHLSLYKWATRRDISDPETIAEVAKTVGSVERLRDLYLLTIADVSTTNPTAMTSWKARMLEDLYLAVAAALDGAAQGSARAAEIRAEVLRDYTDGDALPLSTFLAEMPDRYVLGSQAGAIADHARAALSRGDRPVHVVLRPSSNDDLAELIVMADDQEGLLAAVTAVLASHRLSIVSAEIYTREHEKGGAEAFDVFHVRRHGEHRHRVDESDAESVAADLRQVISGAVSTAELMSQIRRTPSWAERKVPDVATEVVVDNASSPRFTVVDVFSRDRIGLLHEIAKTLHEAGLSIALSKIGTEGARATDVFYVQEAGEKIREPQRMKELRRLVEEAIEAFHARFEEE
jgi:[protein-PII] uridylyltransferase